MNMQQPQMPAGPQPAGIPGGTIVAQNQMQQAPWMGSQMQQGIGGMPQTKWWTTWTKTWWNAKTHGS